MNKKIRIGTRDSKLALWQAKTVQNKLEHRGYKTCLVPIKSMGDLNLEKPLYEMGIVGVFTKTLDLAIINDKIDVAVHSMKDVPTGLPKGILQTAVLERGTSKDILVTKATTDLEKPGIIASSSLRRKAQWLHRFPHHEIVPLRGNVITRLEKLQSNDWHGAIFAKTGLERINILPERYMELDWMLPAPAQGAVVVVSREDNKRAIEATKKLNNETAYKTTYVERMFLRGLEGGCSAPIGAKAHIKNDRIHLNGNLFSLDGKNKIQVEMSCPIKDFNELGDKAAQDVLNRGGKELMHEVKKVTARPNTK